MVNFHRKFMYHIFPTMSCRPLSTSTSGISGESTSSISLKAILLNNHISICACGNPRFCYSTEYNQHRTDPNTLSFIMKLISDLTFAGRLGLYFHVHEPAIVQEVETAVSRPKVDYM